MSTTNRSTAAKKAATRARRNEAKDEPAPVTFDHDGITYRIDPEAMRDLELFEAAEDGNNLIAIRGYLGRDQWDTFKDSIRRPNGRVLAEDAEPFFDKLLEVIGLGNSAASSTS